MTSMRQELSRLYENSVVEVEPTRVRHKAEYVKHTHTSTHARTHACIHPSPWPIDAGR